MLQELSSFLSHPLVSGLLTGVVSGALVYFGTEGRSKRVFQDQQKAFQNQLLESEDINKKPARQSLVKLLVKEVLYTASCCDRLVCYTETSDYLQVPLLNDWYEINLDWASLSTTKLIDQMALFSSMLDPEEVKQLADLARTVANLRVSINTLRNYDAAFLSTLAIYDEERHVRDVYKDAPKIEPEGFVIPEIPKVVSDIPYRVIVGAKKKNGREANSPIYFVCTLHDILFDAIKLCHAIEDFSEGEKYAEFAKEAHNETQHDLEQAPYDDGVYSPSKRRYRIEVKRKAIVEHGFCLLQYVVRPLSENSSAGGQTYKP